MQVDKQVGRCKETYVGRNVGMKIDSQIGGQAMAYIQVGRKVGRQADSCIDRLVGKQVQIILDKYRLRKINTPNTFYPCQPFSWG